MEADAHRPCPDPAVGGRGRAWLPWTRGVDLEKVVDGSRPVVVRRNGKMGHQARSSGALLLSKPSATKASLIADVTDADEAGLDM